MDNFKVMKLVSDFKNFNFKVMKLVFTLFLLLTRYYTFAMIDKVGRYIKHMPCR